MMDDNQRRLDTGAEYSKSARPHFLKRELGQKCRALATACDERDPEMRRIIAEIEAVPLCASRILQTANGIVSALNHRVSSIEQAVVLLGTRRVASVLRQLAAELLGPGAAEASSTSRSLGR